MLRFHSWGLPDTITVEPLPGGYNSQTWSVLAGNERYVAKRVGGDREQFEAGLLIAEILEERGLRAGKPVRTQTGELTIPEEGEWLALLRYVPGNAVPTDTREGLELWGRAMGRAHSLLIDVPPPEIFTRQAAATSGGIDPDAPHLAAFPWVREALAATTRETGRIISSLTHGIIHNDGCETCRDDATGELSVIDWGAAGYGPLISDVGTTRWEFQSGGRPADAFAPFLDAYLAEAPIRPSELEHVDAFVRQRAAMTGWYFAWRIHEGYTAGADAEWNTAGMEQARRAWESLSR